MGVGNLGIRVRDARKAKQLSQEALAREAELSLNLVNKLERGVVTDPHYSTLSGLARALGMTVEQLVEEPVLAGKDEAPPPSGPSRVSKDRLEDQAGKADGAVDPATAAATIGELRSISEGLAAVWNQDVELYERHGRDLRPYRTLEMSSAVVMLYQRFWGALAALQRHAEQLGLNPDVSTWEPQSKQLLLESGSSIRVLAELYEVIYRSAADSSTDSGDFRAMREEFDAGTPAFLVEDPQWPEALEKARVAVGLA